MADQSEEKTTEDPKMWRCGDSYQYPIPGPNGDPWEVVFEALVKKDKVQCEAWKDEVQNLLIFAGLFSAVVTSFVVESYKSLRPESTDLSALLLARIVIRLDNITNSTSAFPFDPELLSLSPSTSTLRVNIFWFLSLVLSLTTVLIGIISLQWLREHQRYSDSLAPRQALGILHMRAEALVSWHVPHIFASLPLLLQAALILFFVGIIEFLLPLSYKVAIPVAVVLGLPILFIIMTTMLPALQCFPVSLRLPSSNTQVPSPCPYKSPQSLLFRRMLTSSRRLFILTHNIVVRIIYTAQTELMSLPKLLGNAPYKVQAWRYRLFPHRAYLFWAHQNWADFDRTWLILRNEHFDITRKRLSGDIAFQPVMTEPMYDSVRALASAAQGNEHHDITVYSVYHCFQNLMDSALSEGDEHRHNHLQACYRDLVPAWNSPISNIASILVDPSPELLHDIHTVLFLRLPGILYKAINPSHIFGKHMLELHTRILVHLYAEEPRKLVDGVVHSPTGFFHWYTINMAEAEDVFLQQFFMLFQSFLKTAATIFDDRIIFGTFHAHSDLDEFISLASFLTWYNADHAVESEASLSVLLATLDVAENALNSRRSFSSGTMYPDFLFCCTTLYLNRVWQERLSIRRVEAHNSKALFSRIILKFDHLQRHVLVPYEEMLELDKFSRVYSKILPPNALPSNFFSKSSRNFSLYGISSGVLPQVSHTLVTEKEKEGIPDSLYERLSGNVADTHGILPYDRWAKEPPPQVSRDIDRPNLHTLLSEVHRVDILGFNTNASNSV